MLATFAVARRSLANGLACVLAAGYAYGFVRAQLPQVGSYFLFDAAVVGLYGAQLLRPLAPEERARTNPLLAWLLVLVAWPLVLLLVPQQDPMVRLVGLRGNVFLLPFLLFGARLDRADLDRLATWCAALNLLAFAVALGEFVLGVPAFLPRNAATAVIYASDDLLGYTTLRIPATFTSAHAYGGTMAMSLVLLLPRVLHASAAGRRLLFAAGSLAAALGIFLSAARTPVLILAVLVGAWVILERIRFGTVLNWAVGTGVLIWLVSLEPRLQRFLTLRDTSAIAERIAGSVNMAFFDLVQAYPMGNGLGGGGTSLPYFLRGRLQQPVYMESEFARILLEQGLPGLLLWMGFVVWVLTRVPRGAGSRADLTRCLCWIAAAAFLLTGLIGIGMLTSVPQTVMVLLAAGVACARHVRAPALRAAVAPKRTRPAPLATGIRAGRPA
jgi:hypothetical protein